MSSSLVTRRLFLSGVAVGVAGAPLGKIEAKERLAVVAQSPFIASSVAVSHEGVVFLGLPRFPGMEKTFSLARMNNKGKPVPFPGGHWNEWQKGQNGARAFVMVNAIHLFRDNTLWVVDQGAPVGSQPELGAQKLVQLDVKTGDIMQVLSFPAAIMPPGARFNDRNRRLYIPCPQLQKLAFLNDGHNEVQAPFLVLSMFLPDSLGGIPLGAGVEG